MNNEEIVAAYTSWLNSWSPSQKTVTARRTLAAARMKAWGLDGFTTENIQQFLGTPDWKRWTRATYHAHLKDFCAWLTASGYLDENPMEDVRKPGRPASLPRPLSEREVEMVLAAAGGRVRDWVRIALLSGLRAHEIAKLRGEDVTTEGIYVEGKGGVRALLPAHPELWEMAQRYPRQGYWFPGKTEPHMAASTITIGVGELFRTLGITGSIHRCRHVYGTRLLRAGVNIRVVQQLMRHASLATTATYTAVDEDEMKAAILRLSA